MSTTPRPPVPMAGFQPDPNADRTLVTVADYERAAAARLPAGPLAYYAGGAMDERTLADNLAAFRGTPPEGDPIEPDFLTVGVGRGHADAPDLDMGHRQVESNDSQNGQNNEADCRHHRVSADGDDLPPRL